MVDFDVAAQANCQRVNAKSADGFICALVLLVDLLESNGALKARQFEHVLSSVLDQSGPGDDANIAVLRELLGMLKRPEKPTLLAMSKPTA